jgi:hypothetical protein
MLAAQWPRAVKSARAGGNPVLRTERAGEQMGIAKLMAVAVLALGAGAAQAKDDALVSAMIGLEKAYINPLFFTNNMNPPKSKASMDAFVAEWGRFAAAYRAYRPSQRNWRSHFETVDQAIALAQPVVAQAAKAFAARDPACALGACPLLVTAHDHLEAVRYAMRDLRIHNGFPKFVTDKLTAYHDPMEAIVLTFKGRTLDQVTAEELAAVGEALDEAVFLWTLVEKCPIDAEAWGFGAAQVAEIERRIAAESAILQALAGYYDAGDFGALAAASMSLKQAFVPVYTAFAGDPLLNKLP